MLIRLALESDEDALIDMARAACEAERTVNPSIPEFSERRARAVFRGYLDECTCTVFVAERRREPVGMLVATFDEYLFSDGLYTTQQVIYVKPDMRGTRAAAALMGELERWSRTLGAREITGGVESQFQPERTERFLRRLGYETFGAFMRRGLHG